MSCVCFRKLTFCRRAHVMCVLSSRASPNQCTFLPSSHPEVTLCNRWEVKTQEQTSSQIGSMKSIVRMIYLVFFQSKYTSVYFLSQISFKDMGTPINDIYMCIYIWTGFSVPCAWSSRVLALPHNKIGLFLLLVILSSPTPSLSYKLQTSTVQSACYWTLFVVYN